MPGREEVISIRSKEASKKIRLKGRLAECGKRNVYKAFHLRKAWRGRAQKCNVSIRGATEKESWRKKGKHAALVAQASARGFSGRKGETPQRARKSDDLGPHLEEGSG